MSHSVCRFPAAASVSRRIRGWHPRDAKFGTSLLPRRKVFFAYEVPETHRDGIALLPLNFSANNILLSLSVKLFQFYLFREEVKKSRQLKKSICSVNSFILTSRTLSGFTLFRASSLIRPLESRPRNSGGSGTFLRTEKNSPDSGIILRHGPSATDQCIRGCEPWAYLNISCVTMSYPFRDVTISCTSIYI